MKYLHYITILIPDMNKKVSGSCSLPVLGPAETPGHDSMVMICMLKVRNSCGCCAEWVRRGQTRTQSDWTAVWGRWDAWVRGESVIGWHVCEVKAESEGSEGKGREVRGGRVKGHQRF